MCIFLLFFAFMYVQGIRMHIPLKISNTDVVYLWIYFLFSLEQHIMVLLHDKKPLPSNYANIL